MLKAKDKVKIKHTDGKLSGNTFVVVDVIDENKCYVCEESAYFGEQPWMEICETRRLVPGEMAWLTYAEWIRKDDAEIVDGCYVPNFVCSRCNDWLREETDFCPSCGAKMFKKEAK